MSETNNQSAQPTQSKQPGSSNLVQIPPYIKQQLLNLEMSFRQATDQYNQKKSELVQNLLAAKEVDLENIERLELQGEFEVISVIMKGETTKEKAPKEVKMKANKPKEVK